jgi:hypothetical protein
MAPRSDPELLVLHALRLKGAASPDVVAQRFALPSGLVEDLIAGFARSGWVQAVEFAGGGWMLTPAGRVEGLARLAAELDAHGARPPVQAAHARFVPLNERFLRTCTDWQLRTAPPTPGSPAAGRLVANDHTDKVWDARVLDELGAADVAVQAVCADLAEVLDRLGGYGGRLATARRRLEAGEHEWFDRPVMDSYHTVWFELHEDLLATLGLERGAIAPPDDPSIAERAS